MTIPLLKSGTTSRNYRVNGFEVQGDDSPRLFASDILTESIDYDSLIDAAYRQLFNEQHYTSSSRQVELESQLRNGQLSVRDFVRSLILSDHFRTRYYETNSNYRFVEICFQRVLGRDVESEREKLAWSIILATKGIEGFARELVESEEYLNSFGDSILPFQRRRTLPQRSVGDVTFYHTARYDANHLQQLRDLGNNFGEEFFTRRGIPALGRNVGQVIGYVGGILVTALFLTIFLSMIGLIKI
ncbi:MAG: phycobilisome rod-core linker polypeptide [Cyanobacteria bacterium P01_F01_bin.42]